MSDKTQKRRISKQYPELMELLVDIAILTSHYTIPDIAKRVGISKQALQKQVNKKLQEAGK